MRKVLILDEDQDSSSNLESFLSANGYKVTKAFNCQTALSYIYKCIFDVVITTDHFTTGTVNEVLVRQMKRLPETVIIICSNDNSLVKKLKYLSFGVDEYLLKPISLFELKLRVERLLLYKNSILKAAQAEYHKVGFNFEKISRVLSRKETKLMHIFAKNQSTIVPIDFLKEYLDLRKANSASVIIHRINQKLKKMGESIIIKAYYGRGYGLKVSA